MDRRGEVVDDPCRGASIVVDVVEETEKAGRPEALARNLPPARAPVYGQPHFQILNFLCSLKACDGATRNTGNIWFFLVCRIKRSSKRLSD